MERSPREAGGAVRRILVALDASPDSMAALDAATQLAADLGAEVVALFVEEEELLRAERSPLVREVEFFSAEPRKLAAGDLERQLRAHARRVHRLVQQMADRMRVPWTFRTSRGRVAEELRRAAEGADLVALGVVGRSLRRGPGSTVRALLEELPGPVLLARRGGHVGRDVYVVYDGSEAGRSAVALAAGLSRREGGRLTVSVVAPTREEAQEKGEELSDDLEASGVPARVHHLPEGGLARMAHLLRARGCGLLVVPRPAVGAEPPNLRELIRHVSCPVVVVE